MISSLVEASDKPITHEIQDNIQQDIIKEKIVKINNNPNLTFSKEETIKLLYDISKFDLGYFLLKNKGLNGYWTSYLILHAPKLNLTNKTENWIVNSAPSVKATRERFYIFQDILQKNLKSKISVASIPCGLMDDLVSLDYSKIKNFKITAIDIDKNSLELAEENVQKHNLSKYASFLHKNAWNLNIKEEYDIITSNGLNIYEPDDQRVVELYKNFYQALKKNGILITSFLTPPPDLSSESPWKGVNQDDIKKQKAIFVDIMEVKWQSFRTEAQTRKQLEEAGFQDIKFIYDTQGIFPTVIARK